MKRLILAVIGVLMLASIAYADNFVRISELKKQQEKVVAELQQAQQFIQSKQAEALKMQGAIEELQSQDAKKVEGKPEVK